MKTTPTEANAGPGAGGAPALKPYKGMDSYEVEDRHLFFGRDRDTRRLIAKILSSTLCLLHARSAAGKTSLLNARIIPELEAGGWYAIRILPQNDPVRAIRSAVLANVIPAPELERDAIERLFERAGDDIGEDLTLGELFEWYDGKLEDRDELKRVLIRPYFARPPVWDATDEDREKVIPFFCRLLRSSIELERFAEHLTVLERSCGNGDSGAEALESVTGDTTLGELHQRLEAVIECGGHGRLASRLDVPGRDLTLFFDNLWDVLAPSYKVFQIVLIIDQFEELFARFVDSGPGEQHGPNWRLRKELFEQLEKLHARQVGSWAPPRSGRAAPTETSFPLRIVLSMRDEYVANLDHVRRFATDLDQCSFHLDHLDYEDALSALREPARAYHYQYSADCEREILRGLVKEGRFVSPPHLQIICENLWVQYGRKLSMDSPEGEGAMREISVGDFLSKGGSRGLVNQYLRALLPEDPLRCQCLLEILDSLVTSSGTRNIVERSQLINRPFRNAKLLEELLDEAERQSIIRVEGRLGGVFAEIRHEFLIDPIRGAVSEYLLDDPEYLQLSGAIRALENIERQDVRRSFLERRNFEVLDKHANALAWPYWAADVMFRAAVRRGAEAESIRAWSERLKLVYAKVPAERMVDSIPDYLPTKRRYDPAELALIMPELMARQNSESEIEFVLKSFVSNPGTDAERMRAWICHAINENG